MNCNQDINARVSLLLSLRVSRAHIVILALLPKQINKQTDMDHTKKEDCKPLSTSLMIDTNGTESEEALRRSRGQ